jgi:hypothetical protein
MREREKERDCSNACRHHARRFALLKNIQVHYYKLCNTTQREIEIRTFDDQFMFAEDNDRTANEQRPFIFSLGVVTRKWQDF